MTWTISYVYGAIKATDMNLEYHDSVQEVDFFKPFKI